VDEIARELIILLKTPLPPGKSRWLIALAGIPGSGKSSLAQQLSQRVHQIMGTEAKREPITVVPMDGYHLTRAQLDQFPNAQEAHARRGSEWTFDPHALAVLLDRLVTDAGTVRAPAFDHAKKDPSPDAIVVESYHKMVIVEGLYLLLQHEPWRSLVLPKFDLRCFISISEKRASKRVVKRHLAAGLSDTIEHAQARWDNNDSTNASQIMTLLDPASVDFWINSVDI